MIGLCCQGVEKNERNGGMYLLNTRDEYLRIGKMAVSLW